MTETAFTQKFTPEKAMRLPQKGNFCGRSQHFPMNLPFFGGRGASPLYWWPQYLTRQGNFQKAYICF